MFDELVMIDEFDEVTITVKTVDDVARNTGGSALSTIGEAAAVAAAAAVASVAAAALASWVVEKFGAD